MVVRDMEALLLSPQNACSFIFRELMPTLIPELSAVAESRRTKRKREESQSRSSSSDNDDVKPQIHDSDNVTPKTHLDDAIILDGEEDKVQQPIQEQHKIYEDFSESDLMFYDAWKYLIYSAFKKSLIEVLNGI